jgi:hypothetical protein
MDTSSVSSSGSSLMVIAENSRTGGGSTFSKAGKYVYCTSTVYWYHWAMEQDILK